MTIYFENIKKFSDPEYLAYANLVFNISMF